MRVNGAFPAHRCRLGGDAEAGGMAQGDHEARGCKR
ncbi:hypothetical protein LMG27177_03428 [Paraburkholderia fynbosensis]|uniref:Uncharacterized protein n=1 Tax=Paraburkholderia fynbosensis TaxID=1200993 RepID=A0A6J5G834_9BURK|nr:hypothetical protein LMG27177_03428 [Paraburkholderia fynbosensis]